MRTAIIAAAFAVSALAVPYQKEKRAEVIQTEVNVVYVTDYTTTTVEGPAPTNNEAAPQNKQGWGWPHRHHHHHNGGAPPAAPTTSTEQAPAPTQSSQPSAPSSPSGGGGSPASSAPAPSGTSYSDLAVAHHNKHRSNHSAPALSWDSGLESSAATIAASCVYAHNVNVDGGGYGQNIAAGVAPDNITAVITDLFYNGEVNNYNGLYGQANPSMANFENWGHFSQIVWKATTHVGCATQDCSGQGLANTGGDVSPYFTVCNYKSAGNFAGEYGQNVGEPLGEPTIQWNWGI